MVVNFGSMNIGDSTIYFFNKRKVDLGTLLFSNSVFIIISSLFYIGIILILSQLSILPWTELKQSYLLIFTLILIPLIFYQTHILDIFRSIKQFNAYNLMQICQPIIYFVLIIYLVYFLKLEVLGALFSYSMTFIIIISIGLCYLYRKTNFNLNFDPNYLKKNLIYGLKGHIGNIFQKFNLRLDQLLISPYWGSAMLGNYSIATSISELIWYIPDSVGIVTLSYISANKKEEALNITLKSIRIVTLLTFISTIVLFFLAKPIILILYGKPFEPSVKAIYFLLPGIFFTSFSKILSKYFSGIGHPEINTFTSFISLLATIIFCVILIPKYGITGAAIASSIAYGIRAICDLILFKKASQYSLSKIIKLEKTDLNLLKNF